MKMRSLHDEAVTKAAACIIATADPARGAEGLEEVLAAFEQSVRAKIASTLMEVMEEIKDMSIEEIRKIAGEN